MFPVRAPSLPAGGWGADAGACGRLPRGIRAALAAPRRDFVVDFEGNVCIRRIAPNRRRFRPSPGVRGRFRRTGWGPRAIRTRTRTRPTVSPSRRAADAHPSDQRMPVGRPPSPSRCIRPLTHEPRPRAGVFRGRYWDRTSDLFRVREARYRCANRPYPPARAGAWGTCVPLGRWRRDSNPCGRLCRPLPSHSATPPSWIPPPQKARPEGRTS
jgi:hypothetical protein